MKKKFLAVVLSLTIATSMLAGCGSSEKDYENDIEIFEDVADLDFDSFSGSEDADDMKDAVKELKKDIKALDFSTKEGKAIKNLLLDFADLMGDFVNEVAKLDEDDDDAWEEYLEISEKYSDKMEDFEDDLEDAMEDFLDAAEDAGVDEDDLEGLGL